MLHYEQAFKDTNTKAKQKNLNNLSLARLIVLTENRQRHDRIFGLHIQATHLFSYIQCGVADAPPSALCIDTIHSVIGC
jgi:hypothetical protein